MSDDPPAGAGTSEDDERLFREVRGLLARLDPVPHRVWAASRAVLAWRTVDADLARLDYDSGADGALPERALAAVRGAATGRVLVFDGPDMSIDLQVVDAGGRRTVLGQLAPAQAGEVTMRSRDGLRTTLADDRGRFRFDDVGDGPTSLRCTTADGTVARTAWFRL